MNNAVSDSLLNRYRGKNSLLEKTKSLNKNKVITYIGTISQWINWDLILKSLKSFDNIEYHFYGPLDCTVPSHERIFYKGILPQNKIADAMQASDLLVMPFYVNSLIESVNPVKLYEYILSGIPSMACGYSESEKFSDYVYLYYNEKIIWILFQCYCGKSFLPKIKMANISLVIILGAIEQKKYIRF